MSTSLNDTVAAIYREFMTRIDEQNRILNEQTFTQKLAKYISRPSLIWPRVKGEAKKRFKHACVKIVFGRKAVSIAPPMSMNVFTPTDRTYPGIKIAVYTVITGGYDDLKKPAYVDDDIDYYIVTDSHVDSVDLQTGGGHRFITLPVPEHLKGLSNVKKQRYLKLHPDEVLSENTTGRKYDYTIYIDGSGMILCDIKPLVYSLIESGRSIAIHNHCVRNCIYDEALVCYVQNVAALRGIREQIGFYRTEGMPEHFGLPETPFIIRKCNDPQLQSIMHQWWGQIERFTHRDQISLPYVLWKNGLDMSYIFSLGNNVWRNPYLLYTRHKAKRFRRIN